MGTYALRTRTMVSVTSPIQQQETRQTRDTLVVSSTHGADMVFNVTSQHGDRCVLNANREGPSTVRFLPGQRCDVRDPVRNIPLSLTLSDGTGTLRGRTLSLNLNWSVTGQVLLLQISGTATQSASGARR